MPLRLVYLPDPTIKFFYSKENCEYFADFEIGKFDTDMVEVTIRPKKAHFNILNTLIKRFQDVETPKPYFDTLLDRIELFQVMEVPDGKASKTGA